MDPVSVSFCIKTNRKKEWKLISSIASILSLGIQPGHFEILVTGDTDFAFLDGEMAKHVRAVPDRESADNGRLATMMNTLAREAAHPWILMCDDDLVFCEGWYEKLCLFLAGNPDVDLCAFPIRNVDGSRFWDWAIFTEDRSILIDPRAQDPRMYVTGTIGLLRRAVWDAHKWDDSRGFYQNEDTDWSQRAIAAGCKVALCKAAYVLHNDWRYFQVGPGIHRSKEMADSVAVADRPLANSVFGQYLEEIRQALASLGGGVGDIRWQGLAGLNTEDKGRLAEIIGALGVVEDKLGEVANAVKTLRDLAV